ncbi:hypothetical protein AMTR_s00207p00018950 [Amborella trichopoda]|uniref:Uncharacterized protein n=1 Tax=Amborella trichopoda TaxID=13333 RepID=W1P5P0_AMBTC|nr:hypothetical protein AMTR_s00207p00018950 [Amborella trichopoda]
MVIFVTVSDVIIIIGSKDSVSINTCIIISVIPRPSIAAISTITTTPVTRLHHGTSHSRTSYLLTSYISAPSHLSTSLHNRRRPTTSWRTTLDTYSTPLLGCATTTELILQVRKKNHTRPNSGRRRPP